MERKDNETCLMQPHLISQILCDTGLENTKHMNMPALVLEPLD